MSALARSGRWTKVRIEFLRSDRTRGARSDVRQVRLEPSHSSNRSWSKLAYTLSYHYTPSRAGEGQAACASQAKGVRAPRFRMGRDGPVSWLGVSQPSRPEGRCLTNRDHRATPDHVRGRRPVMTSGWDAPFPAPSSIGHGTAAPKGQALATDR